MDKALVLSRLDFKGFYKTHLPSLKENGRAEANALCPFHADTHPSLSVNLTSPGLYHCFSCNAKGDVFRFYQDLKKADFKTALVELGRIAGVETGPSNGQGKTVAVYEYQDVQGQTLYRKERIEPGRNGRSKEFFFKHLEGDKWAYGRSVDPVPYNLPELVKAQYCIIIVEGEGKVGLLAGWGLVATSLDSGASSPWRQEYLPYFEGKKVAILPDNDTPGKGYADRIAEALHDRAKEIKIINLPGLKESEDIIDWQAGGGTKDRLLELIKQAPPWSPPIPGIQCTPESRGAPLPQEGVGDNGDTGRGTSFVRVRELLEYLEAEPPMEWLVDGILPYQSLTMLAGRPGVGKSWLVLALAKAVSGGGLFLGRETRRAEVFYFDLENSRPVVRSRLRLLRPMEVFYAPAFYLDKPLNLKDRTLDGLARDGAVLIFDSFSRTTTGLDQNTVQEMSGVMTRLRELVNLGATILFVHHRGKAEDSQYMGSTDILAGVDMGLLLDRKDEALELRTIKNRLGEDFEIPIRLEIGTEVEIKDISRELEAKNLENQRYQFETLAKIIEELAASGTPPTQKEVLERGREELGWGRNSLLAILKKGEGRYWKSGKCVNTKARIYRIIQQEEVPINLVSV